jgi:hypothetical protein
MVYFVKAAITSAISLGPFVLNVDKYFSLSLQKHAGNRIATSHNQLLDQRTRDVIENLRNIHDRGL